jgi:hypothetical protein
MVSAGKFVCGFHLKDIDFLKLYALDIHVREYC